MNDILSLLSEGYALCRESNNEVAYFAYKLTAFKLLELFFDICKEKDSICTCAFHVYSNSIITDEKNKNSNDNNDNHSSCHADYNCKIKKILKLISLSILKMEELVSFVVELDADELDKYNSEILSYMINKKDQNGKIKNQNGSINSLPFPNLSTNPFASLYISNLNESESESESDNGKMNKNDKIAIKDNENNHFNNDNENNNNEKLLETNEIPYQTIPSCSSFNRIPYSRLTVSQNQIYFKLEYLKKKFNRFFSLHLALKSQCNAIFIDALRDLVDRLVFIHHSQEQLDENLEKFQKIENIIFEFSFTENLDTIAIHEERNQFSNLDIEINIKSLALQISYIEKNIIDRIDLDELQIWIKKRKRSNATFIKESMETSMEMNMNIEAFEAFSPNEFRNDYPNIQALLDFSFYISTCFTIYCLEHELQLKAEMETEMEMETLSRENLIKNICMIIDLIETLKNIGNFNSANSCIKGLLLFRERIKENKNEGNMQLKQQQQQQQDPFQFLPREYQRKYESLQLLHSDYKNHLELRKLQLKYLENFLNRNEKDSDNQMKMEMGNNHNDNYQNKGNFFIPSINLLLNDLEKANNYEITGMKLTELENVLNAMLDYGNDDNDHQMELLTCPDNSIQHWILTRFPIRPLIIHNSNLPISDNRENGNNDGILKRNENGNGNDNNQIERNEINNSNSNYKYEMLFRQIRTNSINMETF